MLLYHVQGHTGYDDFKAVVDRFRGDGNQFVFTIDGKASLPEVEIERLQSLNPIAISKSYPITWISISQINSMLDAMRASLVNKDWKYYVNISTTDIPLKPQEDIKRFLLKGERQKDLGYVYLHKTIDFSPELWTAGGDDLVDRSLRPDTRILVSKELSDHFDGWGPSPLLAVHTRTSYHCSEIGEIRTLFTRPLFDIEARARAAFFAKFPYRIGRIWVCLHREVVEHILESTDALYVHEMLKGTFVPDEAFFQTLLFAESSPFKNHIVPYNMHLRFGEPVDLRDGHLEELKNSPAFFARKFIPQQAPAVDAWVTTLQI
jgi:hypothetical protein